MDKDVATRLMDHLVRCHKAIDAAEIVARGIDDPEERDKIRKALAEASGQLYVEIMMGLIRAYPELDPYPKP